MVKINGQPKLLKKITNTGFLKVVCGGAVDIFYDILRYLTKNMFSNFWKRLTFIIAQAGFELMPFIFVAYSIFFNLF